MQHHWLRNATNNLQSESNLADSQPAVKYFEQMLGRSLRLQIFLFDQIAGLAKARADMTPEEQRSCDQNTKQTNYNRNVVIKEQVNWTFSKIRIQLTNIKVF